MPNLHLFACICTLLWSLIAPIFRDNDAENIIKHTHFENSIILSTATEGWGCVDFNQPWLQRIVNQNIKPIHLVTMLVIYDDTLDRLQWDVDDLADHVKTLFSLFLASGHLEVELQILDVPFATVRFIIFGWAFLHCDIGQVDHHVINFSCVLGVFFCAESRKALWTEINSQRAVACNEHVESQIKLFASNE